MSAHKVAQTSTRGLAFAIILQAIVDYIAIRRGQVAENEDINAEELNEFFASDWFGELCEMCDIDKKMILRNLDKSTLLFKHLGVKNG